MSHTSNSAGTDMNMRYPAAKWQDGLPCGNGTVGALAYGNVAFELILINHERLFLPCLRPAVKPLHEHLPVLRRLLTAGRYAEAADFWKRKALEVNPDKGGPLAYIDPYQPMFDIALNTGIRGDVSGYRCGLDFATGEATVTWREKTFGGGAAADCRRRMFVSRADDAVVMSISTTDGQGVDCRVGLRPHDGDAGRNAPALPFRHAVEADDEGWTFFRAAHENGQEFGGLARVTTVGGRVCSEDDLAAGPKAAMGNGIGVRGAREVLIVLKLFVGEDADTARRRLRAEIERIEPDYDALFARHAPLHGGLFNRLTFSLGKTEKAVRSNEELLMECHDGKPPDALMQRMFFYGRYLLIASSRPGGLPPNLQGIWNGSYNPCWSCAPHNDVNMEMNHWQALPGNLAETALPYFDYYESLLDDFRLNAKALFGCRGILAPPGQSTHGLVVPGDQSTWTAGAGWLAQLFYDYWLFTGDRTFLEERAVPFMREVALFYEDFLVEDAKGELAFMPSVSPENTPGNQDARAHITINSTMDIAVAREVLTNLCTACGVLCVEAENVEKWRRMIARLPAYRMDEEGALKEWAPPDFRDNYFHRHMSHAYPLFPGREATGEANPALVEAVRLAADKRLAHGFKQQTGWALVFLAGVYARAGAGDRALECLERLCRFYVGVNLFTYHDGWIGWSGGSIFQIDANLGFTAVILEMLVQSGQGLVKLLPALPEKWRSGRSAGVRCRGGIEVDIEWDMGARTVVATMVASANQEIDIKFPLAPRRVESSHRVQESTLGPMYRRLALPAARRVSLQAHV